MMIDLSSLAFFLSKKEFTFQLTTRSKVARDTKSDSEFEF